METKMKHLTEPLFKRMRQENQEEPEQVGVNIDDLQLLKRVKHEGREDCEELGVSIDDLPKHLFKQMKQEKPEESEIVPGDENNQQVDNRDSEMIPGETAKTDFPAARSVSFIGLAPWQESRIENDSQIDDHHFEQHLPTETNDETREIAEPNLPAVQKVSELRLEPHAVRLQTNEFIDFTKFRLNVFGIDFLRATAGACFTKFVFKKNGHPKSDCGAFEELYSSNVPFEGSSYPQHLFDFLIGFALHHINCEKVGQAIELHNTLLANKFRDDLKMLTDSDAARSLEAYLDNKLKIEKGRILVSFRDKYKKTWRELLEHLTPQQIASTANDQAITLLPKLITDNQ